MQPLERQEATGHVPHSEAKGGKGGQFFFSLQDVPNFNSLTTFRPAKTMARQRSRLARNVAAPPRLRPPTRTMMMMNPRSLLPRRARRLQRPALTTPLPQRKVAAAPKRPLPLTTKTTPKSRLLRRRLEAVLASQSRRRRRSKKSKKSRLRSRRRLGAALASLLPPTSKTRSKLR